MVEHANGIRAEYGGYTLWPMELITEESLNRGWGQTFEFIGIGVLVSGILLFIVGLVIQPKKVHYESKKIFSNKEDELRNEVIPKISEQKPQDEAIKIIQLRYAKGEITKEQYEQMKEELND